MLDAFAKAAKEVLAEEAGKDPMFKKVLRQHEGLPGNRTRKWHNLGYLPRDFE